MPHCIIEHSNDLAQLSLLNAVYDGAKRSQLFGDADIKTRTIGFDHYQSGPTKESFVHVTAKILSGRSLEQRTMLAQLILAELEKLSLTATSLTVEVLEIEKASYAKVVTSA